MSTRRIERADPAIYRPPAHLTLAERALEQNMAAGGHETRLVLREDGRSAAASVSLRCFPRSRRVYAYLRWSDGRGTTERYLGDVSEHPDRASALRAAWALARRQRSLVLFATPPSTAV